MSPERRAASLLLLGAVAGPSLAREALGQRVPPPAAATALDAPSPAAHAWTRATDGIVGADGATAGSPVLAPRALAVTPRDLGAASAASAAAAGGPTGGRRTGWAPAASALLPGTGQAMLRQSRFVPYLALEAYAWLRYVSDSREARRQRSSYRDVARNVARAGFSSSPPVGSWEYYERMEHYVESGAYDAADTDGLQPESDTLSYNGAVWLLARRTYWADAEQQPDPSSPAYASAVSFYRQRAVTAPYRWSWRGAQLEQDVFRQTIARSNDAYRRAAQELAVVIANHVLSTVDAYVTVRLRARRGAGEREAPGGGGGGYGLSVSLPLRGLGAAGPRAPEAPPSR